MQYRQRGSLLSLRDGCYLSEAGVHADEALCWRTAAAIEPLLQALLGLGDPMQVQLVPKICQQYALQIHNRCVPNWTCDTLASQLSAAAPLQGLHDSAYHFGAARASYCELNPVEAQSTCLLEDHEDVPAATGGLEAAHGALQAVAGHNLCIQLPVVRLHVRRLYDSPWIL